MDIILYLLVGLLVGGISGTLGIGGGVLLIPILVWLFGFDHPKATGTTLAVLVPPIGLLAAWEYYQKGLLDLRAALCIAAAFVLGAYGGALLMPLLPVTQLRFFFGLLLIFVAVRFLLAADAEAASAFVGLLAVGLAWLVYAGLRLLGRRYPSRPDLEAAIQMSKEKTRGESDYYI